MVAPRAAQNMAPRAALTEALLHQLLKCNFFLMETNDCHQVPSGATRSHQVPNSAIKCRNVSSGANINMIASKLQA